MDPSPPSFSSPSILQPQAQAPRAPSPPPLSAQLTTREKLLFAQAVHKVGAGDKHWKEVGGLMAGCPLVEGEERKEAAWWSGKVSELWPV